MGRHRLLARRPNRDPASTGRAGATGRDRRRDRAKLRNHAAGRGGPHMSSDQTVIAMGVHVVDVLARPVTEIPEGQGGELVEEIRVTPAGSAGGTAITLAKLGAEVDSAGAIGRGALRGVLGTLLQRFGVGTGMLVR